jgi:hypothetical protein
LVKYYLIETGFKRGMPKTLYQSRHKKLKFKIMKTEQLKVSLLMAEELQHVNGGCDDKHKPKKCDLNGDGRITKIEQLLCNGFIHLPKPIIITPIHRL